MDLNSNENEYMMTKRRKLHVAIPLQKFGFRVGL